PGAGPGDLLTACAFTEVQAAVEAPNLTSRGDANSGGFYCAIAARIAPSVGPVGASFTGPGSGWVTMAALFTAAPGGPSDGGGGAKAHERFQVGSGCSAASAGSGGV